MNKRQNETSRIHNSSYYFIPFAIDNKIEREKIDPMWEAHFRDTKYFLKYITTNINSFSDFGYRYSFTLSEWGRNKLNIISDYDLCTLEERRYSQELDFNYYIKDIRMFLFDTKIGFLVINIRHMNNEDPNHIASKNYHLKKVYNAKTSYSMVKNKSIRTLYSLSEYILKNTLKYNFILFFNFNNENEFRCNVLTHYHYKLESDIQKDNIKAIKKQLFYLKRNYHSEWDFQDEYLESTEFTNEYFEASPYIHWAITSEAAVCITVSTPNVFFVGNSFYDNFHSYYLYVYVLALHQKFELYNLLTSFNRTYNKELDVMPKNENIYKSCVDELIDFRAKHVFAIISESNTYQTVYEKACYAFSLQKLFNDIDEQSNKALASIDKRINDRREKYQQQISLVIGIIAFFGYFPAIESIILCIDKLSLIIPLKDYILATKIIVVSLLSVLWIILFIKYCIDSKKMR